MYMIVLHMCLQVRPKVHYGFLRGYVGHDINRPIVFHKLSDVFDFGTDDFDRVQWNLYGYFCVG